MRSGSDATAQSVGAPAGTLSDVDSAEGGPLLSEPIRHRQLKQLVQTAASLPGPKIELTPWDHLGTLGNAASDASAPMDPVRLRALVGQALAALARRVDEVLPRALARARQAWDKIDDLTIVDEELAATLAATRGALLAATGASPQQRAVALEGLLALDAARGLAGLAERGFGSLIRLWVRGQDDDLLPQGRPFLDLGAALAEAARAWA